MENAEFERLQKELNKVIDRHVSPFGPMTDERRSAPPWPNATCVVLALSTPGGAVDAMNRRAELERLQRFRRAAGEFVKAWDSLHWDIRGIIMRSSGETGASLSDDTVPA